MDNELTTTVNDVDRRFRFDLGGNIKFIISLRLFYTLILLMNKVLLNFIIDDHTPQYVKFSK